MLKKLVKYVFELSYNPTIISSIISACIAIAVIFINKWYEKRKEDKRKHDVYKRYANPIISACESLAWRLKEVLEQNGAYLLPNAPQNDYFKYKFDSTVYRLCALLGWLQASNKEQSYFECENEEHYKKIQAATASLRKSLADGSHVEVSILDELIKLFNLEITTNVNRELMAAHLESIIFKYIKTNNAREVISLPEARQIQMVKNILDYICYCVKCTKVPEKLIKERLQTAINEISRYYCWIYRDWQTAIGELMIKGVTNANRRFDVIGFGEFQSIRIENEWINKVDVLFSSLDVSIDDRFDARVKQLKNVFCSCISLIESLKEHLKKHETITDESFMALKQFKNNLNV